MVAKPTARKTPSIPEAGQTPALQDSIDEGFSDRSHWSDGTPDEGISQPTCLVLTPSPQVTEHWCEKRWQRRLLDKWGRKVRERDRLTSFQSPTSHTGHPVSSHTLLSGGLALALQASSCTISICRPTSALQKTSLCCSKVSALPHSPGHCGRKRTVRNTAKKRPHLPLSLPRSKRWYPRQPGSPGTPCKTSRPPVWPPVGKVPASPLCLLE